MWLILIGSIGIDYTMTTYMSGQVYIGPGTVYNCQGMSICNASYDTLYIRQLLEERVYDGNWNVCLLFYHMEQYINMSREVRGYMPIALYMNVYSA